MADRPRRLSPSAAVANRSRNALATPDRLKRWRPARDACWALLERHVPADGAVAVLGAADRREHTPGREGRRDRHGPARRAVTVRTLFSCASAKKLKIACTISSKKATIDARGAALLSLDVTTTAGKAIDKHRPALKVTVEAVAGSVKKTATGTLTR